MNAFLRRVVLGWVVIPLLPLACPLHADEPGFPGPGPAPQSALAAASTPSAPPLFIARYVSVYTAHGMAGFVPGSPVRLVRRASDADRLTVTDGQYEVEVNSTQVTDDPVAAGDLRRQAADEDRAARMAAAVNRSVRRKSPPRPNQPAPAPTLPANVPTLFASVPAALPAPTPSAATSLPVLCVPLEFPREQPTPPLPPLAPPLLPHPRRCHRRLRRGRFSSANTLPFGGNTA